MPRFPRRPGRNRTPVPGSSSSSSSGFPPPSTSNSTNADTQHTISGTSSSMRRFFDFTFDTGPIHSSRSGFRMCARSTSFLEPDPQPQDIDSQSLSESVINFPEEFGRTYPAFRPGSYAFPNDDIEIRRQELEYLTLNEVAQNRLHFAPWSAERPPTNVLDIATGTGSWAIDMADLYPEAHVQGNDLSPIQPRQVPPLVHFFIEDAEDEWHYPDPFDYIHTRCCLGSFRDFNVNIVQQAFRNLCPGGWFESQELECVAYTDDDTLSPSAPLAVWSREMIEASVAFGRPLDVAKSLLMWYEAAGFVDVEEIVYKIPMGAWPRDPAYKAVGRKWQQVFLDGLSGFSLMLFNRHFGRTKEEIEATLVGVRKDVMDHKIHSYHKYHVVIGRKPFPGELERRRAEMARGREDTEMANS